MSLTKKQKIFVDEYLIDLNATRAYKAAYPNVKKDATAAQSGSRLLRNVKVAEYISMRMQERQKRVEITQDQVIAELAAIAFSCVTDYVEIKDNRIYVKDTSKLTEEQKKAIVAIKEGKNGIEIKLYNKEKALEALGRHLGMFNEEIINLRKKELELRERIVNSNAW